MTWPSILKGPYHLNKRSPRPSALGWSRSSRRKPKIHMWGAAGRTSSKCKHSRNQGVLARKGRCYPLNQQAHPFSFLYQIWPWKEEEMRERRWVKMEALLWSRCRKKPWAPKNLWFCGIGHNWFLPPWGKSRKRRRKEEESLARLERNH